MSVCYSISAPWLDRCQGSTWDGLAPLGHMAPMKFTLGDPRGEPHKDGRATRTTLLQDTLGYRGPKTGWFQT